jgi:galactoside 2-L-fucosyltransferase 1/2
MYRLIKYQFAGGGSPTSDMALMSACNHSIIDYGSYGVWGAALAGGDVVTPQHITQNYDWQFGSGRLNWTQLEGF